MKSFRLTLVSDATNEYPDNKNSTFKVRLPVPLNLVDNNWHASLWSVSVPDEGHRAAVIDNKDTQILKFSYTLTKRYKDGAEWKVMFEEKKKEEISYLKESHE